MTTCFVDSHCHLDGPEFDADRDEVIVRARAAGVRYFLMIGTGTDLQQVAGVIPVAERYDGAYAAAGIHPHEAHHFLKDDFGALREMARHPKFLAWGEIGLDYHYNHSSPEVQKEILVRQLELACELKRPVIIHCRDAWAELRQVLKGHGRGSGGILHCFTGNREDAFELMDWGFMISFAGNLTFRNADNLRAVAAAIPLDRLLTETDSPYLAPVPYRGKRSEPAYVCEVLRELASIHKLSEEEMGDQVLKNFTGFFHL